MYVCAVCKQMHTEEQYLFWHLQKPEESRTPWPAVINHQMRVLGTKLQL